MITREMKKMFSKEELEGIKKEVRKMTIDEKIKDKIKYIRAVDEMIFFGKISKCSTFN